MESNGGPSRREFDELKQELKDTKRDYMSLREWSRIEIDFNKEFDALNKFKDWVFYGFLGAIIVSLGIALVMGALK